MQSSLSQPPIHLLRANANSTEIISEFSNETEVTILNTNSNALNLFNVEGYMVSLCCKSLAKVLMIKLSF